MKRCALFLLLLVCGFLFTPLAFAENDMKKPHCAFTWTFYSEYIWRGLRLNKTSQFLFSSMIEDFQQGLNSGRGLGIYLGEVMPWEETKTVWENDGILAYQDQFPLNDKTAINWRLGWTNLGYALGEGEEVFASFGLTTFLAPEISIFKGTEFKDSLSINLSLSHSWDLSKCWLKADGWTLGLGSGLSYYDFEDDTYSNWRDANVWADLNISFHDGCSLIPSVNYSFPVNDVGSSQLPDGTLYRNESSFVFGGVKLNIPF